jgi:hypothetical protein
MFYHNQWINIRTCRRPVSLASVDDRPNKSRSRMAGSAVQESEKPSRFRTLWNGVHRYQDKIPG